MFYHQKVARVRVFADIQNFALHGHCVHGIPTVFTNKQAFEVETNTSSRVAVESNSIGRGSGTIFRNGWGGEVGWGLGGSLHTGTFPVLGKRNTRGTQRQKHDAPLSQSNNRTRCSVLHRSGSAPFTYHSKSAGQYDLLETAQRRERRTKWVTVDTCRGLKGTHTDHKE